MGTGAGGRGRGGWADGIGIIHEEGETVTPLGVWASLFYERPDHVQSKANGLSWVVYGDQRVGLEKLPAGEKKRGDAIRPFVLSPVLFPYLTVILRAERSNPAGRLMVVWAKGAFRETN